MHGFVMVARQIIGRTVGLRTIGQRNWLTVTNGRHSTGLIHVAGQIRGTVLSSNRNHHKIRTTWCPNIYPLYTCVYNNVVGTIIVLVNQLYRPIAQVSRPIATQ